MGSGKIDERFGYPINEEIDGGVKAISASAEADYSTGESAVQAEPEPVEPEPVSPAVPAPAEPEYAQAGQSQKPRGSSGPKTGIRMVTEEAKRESDSGRVGRQRWTPTRER